MTTVTPRETGQLDQYLDLSTVSARTLIAYSTLRSYVASGRLPAVRVAGSRRYLVKAEDVESLLVPVTPHNQPEGA
jgi:excisionase family DNA binding protein